jgi:hypothetical protein
MRNLYNRKKKLDYWTERIHKDLDEHDKKDVLKSLEIMQEKDQSILTITRCISIVIQIRKQIDKSLFKVTKEDIKAIPRCFMSIIIGGWIYKMDMTISESRCNLSRCQEHS